MEIVKLADFFNWIEQQPDDKEINWLQNERNADCGCIMVQYGIEKGFEFGRCGSSSWINGPNLEKSATFENRFPFYAVVPKNKQETCTYQDVKKLIPALRDNWNVAK